MNAPLQTLYEALVRHIPASAAWVPHVCAILLASLGVLLVVRGARYAPILTAIVVSAATAWGGWYCGAALNVPTWPSAIAGAVIGVALGIYAFRFWLATLLAGSFVAGALLIFGARTVYPQLKDYTSQGYVESAGAVGVSLPDPGATIGAKSADQAVGQIWDYLSANVPGFDASVWALTISTALAGLAVGILLPKFSRALVAATAGTICLGIALWALLSAFWPTAWDYLVTAGAWGWIPVGLVWGGALWHNFRSVRKKRPAKEPAEKEKPALRPARA